MSESLHEKAKAPLLGDACYNALKRTATVLLPAAGALYFALAQIWGLPRAEEVVGSIAALNTFIGVLVGVSAKTYAKTHSAGGSRYVGELQVESSEDGEKTTFSLVVDGDPENLAYMDEATFRVNRP